MSKITILTASFGTGHRTAALNLQKILGEESTEVLDWPKLAFPLLNKLVKFCYLLSVRRFPNLYGFLYKITDSKKINAAVAKKMSSRRIPISKESKLLITTYPLPIKLSKSLKLLTVITDFWYVHAMWLLNPESYYLVMDEKTKENLIKRGVAAEKITVSHFPLDPLSFRVKSKTHKKIQITWVLDVGAQPAVRALQIQKTLKHFPDLEFHIVTGRNTYLYKLLQKQQLTNLKLYSWVDNMPEMLVSSDINIIKSGGAMVSEALAAKKPVLLYQSIPGQERGNREFVTQGGYGFYCPHTYQLWSKINLLSKKDDNYQQITENLGKLDYGRKNQDIPRLIDNLLKN